MVNKRISEWDFVKQEPKKSVVVGELVGNTPFTIGVVDSMIHISENNTRIHNLTVTGSLELPPREGDMRTVMGEDGYWLTQVYRNVWWTINRTESMITVGQTFVPTQRVSIWSRIKKFFKIQYP
tara:strand:+ start:54 stop:425 length:372 start_codon:yes stop_codon:yes gene_type:complete